MMKSEKVAENHSDEGRMAKEESTVTEMWQLTLLG
jgi:hypothetical protein